MLTSMFQYFLGSVKNQKGAVAIEYALVAGLVGLAIVVGATALGTGLDGWFDALATYVGGLEPTPAP